MGPGASPRCLCFVLAVLLAARGVPASELAEATKGDEKQPDAKGDAGLTQKCDVGSQKQPEEVLQALRGCEDALEAFAKKTAQGRDLSQKENEELQRQYREVLAMLAKLKDYKSMTKAFDEDQKEAMDFLLKEAGRAEAEIKTLKPS
mmetsp:Transcript_20757/g.58416  ORF Transcript_20757/g.58416 Transcript_20757/m.58416 type:complete len:147 (-) Transcript_20757:80-520(-)